MNPSDLKSFLYKTNQAGYATGKYSSWIKEKDGSTTIHFIDKDWEAHDNFFGGEPFGGRLVVFHKQIPIWMMVYYGFITDYTNVTIEEVYKYLQSCLADPPLHFPIRGKRHVTNKKYGYTNNWTGDIENFNGTEIISFNKKCIYKATYLGGWINLRSE